VTNSNYMDVEDLEAYKKLCRAGIWHLMKSNSYGNLIKQQS